MEYLIKRIHNSAKFNTSNDFKTVLTIYKFCTSIMYIS